MRRDRLTFGMMVGIPLLQLILFGFAINLNPEASAHGGVCGGQQRVFAHAGLGAAQQRLFRRPCAWRGARRRSSRCWLEGRCSSWCISRRISRARLLRGERPSLLLRGRRHAIRPPPATRCRRLSTLVATVFDRDLKGPLADLRARPGSGRTADPHRHYNPDIITQYNIVPGLMGVVLTMTMVIITALAITRERERGTMENLLSTPVRPGEVMIGKIIPYIVVGYVQVVLILLAARFLFRGADGGQRAACCWR